MRRTLGGLAALALYGPAFAQEDAVVVTATRAPRPALEIPASVDRLYGADIRNGRQQVNLSESLNAVPGIVVQNRQNYAQDLQISSRGFGARSTFGVRGIRLYADGIPANQPDGQGQTGNFDLGAAERIEVLRGPSSLLYGSSAIGGVVNVIDTRIPRAVPDGGVSGDVLLNYGSAASERSANAAVNAALGSNLVAHADAAYSKYDDLRIGGHVLSRPLREIAEGSSDPEIRELADLKDRLPNTAGRLFDLAGGLAWIDGPLNLGVSLGHHEAKYGVPIRYSLDPAIEPEAPVIDARQNRVDVRAEVPLGGFFKSANLRGGISRYRHKEIEDSGEIGSRFFSNGGEGRFELVQADRNGWDGTSGVQYLDQSARIRGEEKYLPDSRNRQIGLFTLQSLARGPLRIEGGARVEFARIHADADPALAAQPVGSPEIGAQALSRRFTPVSLSVGGNYDLGRGWRTGLSFSHSERAPAVDELFSRGPHGGSQTFNVGDPNLSKEKSNGLELSLVQLRGPIHVRGSLYYSRFSNFIFQATTGSFADDLPVYEYREGKAKYYGFEAEADAKLGRALGIDWGGELVADAVRATIRGFGPAPQIPPFRVLGALTGARGKVDGRLEVERVSAQRRNAVNETPTPGFTMVNASLDWHPLESNPALTLSLQGNNLFDVNARRATSLLKDYAPLAGRDIRLTARMSF